LSGLFAFELFLRNVYATALRKILAYVVLCLDFYAILCGVGFRADRANFKSFTAF